MSDVIALDGINKRLGERKILKDVSFAVERGDIFGFLGPNGAGKTTSIRILLGLFEPDSGSARLLGRDPSDDTVREEVGFVLEADGLYDNLSAYDNLLFYGEIYGVPNLRLRIEEVLGLGGLADRGGDKVGTYSKGMRQRLAISRALLHDPAVLILDEPTAGVDPTGQIDIRAIMLALVKRGKTILLSSHNLDEVQRICNRIALIHKGEIRLAGDLRQLERDMSRGVTRIETTESVPDRLVEELRQHMSVSVEGQGAGELSISGDGKLDIPAVVAFLAANGVGIEQVKRGETPLEDLYVAIVREAEKE